MNCKKFACKDREFIQNIHAINVVLMLHPVYVTHIKKLLRIIPGCFTF